MATTTRRRARAASPAPVPAPAAAPVQIRILNSGVLARSREQNNPLRGLTIAKAVQLLEQTQRGIFASYQWTTLFVEETDEDLMAIIENRLAKLRVMDVQVKLPEELEGSDLRLAEEQADFLRSLYSGIGNLSDALGHLSLASFRRYAHLQKQDDSRERVVALGPRWLECVPQWNIGRAGMFGPWYLNPAAQDVDVATLGDALRLDPATYLVRERARPINRVALLKYVRAGLSNKDWDSWIETFGDPSGILIMPPDVGEGDAAAYQAAAQSISEGASAAIPNGADVKWPDSVRGSAPFKDRLTHLTEKLVQAGTGGKLTMLAQSGSGTLAGSVQDDIFKDLMRGEAEEISLVLQTQLDDPELDAAFPNQPHHAYAELNYRESTTTSEILADAVKLSSTGYRIDQAQLEAKTGYTLLPIQSPPAFSPIQNRKSEIQNHPGPVPPRAPAGGPGPYLRTGRAGMRVYVPRVVRNRTADGATPSAPASAGVSSSSPLEGAAPSVPSASGATPAPAKQADPSALGRVLAQVRLALPASQSAVLAPVRAALESALSAPDSTLASACQQFLSDLPALARQINASPATADILHQAIAASAALGLSEAGAPRAQAKQAGLP